jgi:ABC-type multidrug transport system ATPase subunit
LLTVRESMTFAVKLKTGSAMNDQQQCEKIISILESLKLNEHLDTFVRNLSGGQQKRLSIAVELVDDPKILFLDEPTTGLDSSASTQCIKLLKQLARDGRTIVCTIHTPSALLFEMFDHIYAMAEGSCIYQGSSKNLVPFLSDLGLVCPETYNPSDFLLEIATNNYGLQNHRMIEKIKNGKSRNYSKNTEMVKNRIETKPTTLVKNYSSSFFNQFNQLMHRNFLILKRDTSPIILRFLIHFIVGILVGLLYIDIGNNAAYIFNVFKYIFVSMFFLLYTSYYSLQTACKYQKLTI